MFLEMVSNGSSLCSLYFRALPNFVDFCACVTELILNMCREYTLDVYRMTSVVTEVSLIFTQLFAI